MDKYTPTTDAVRDAWWRDQIPAGDPDLEDVYNAAFDRWLGKLLTEVRSQGFLLGARHGWDEAVDAFEQVVDSGRQIDALYMSRTNPYRITEEDSQ